jgi:uncharacterized membrane protein YeiH
MQYSTEEPVLAFFNAVGLIAFAFSGAVTGISENLDLFGIALLGIVTALGGGALRDILVLTVPAMLKDFSYVGFAFLGIALAILARHSSRRFLHRWYFLVSDTIGLASFTVSGCLVASLHHLGIIGHVLLGLSTAIGGGLLRDMLVGRVSLILRREVYASCSIAGAIIFWALAGNTGTQTLASLVAMLVTFGMRITAIKYNWQLPKFSRAKE